MKTLFISKEGDSSALWWKMQNEGSQVWAWIKEPWARRVMQGIVPTVSTLEEGLSKRPDTIVFDGNGMGEIAEKLRKDGFKVFGGSKLADKLEYDRSYGGKVAQQYGILVPRTQRFEDIKSAIDFVKKTNKAYAIKIDGGETAEVSSYVAKDAEDMVSYLEYSQEVGNIPPKASFIIQEKIEGAEVSTEVIFSDGNPCWPASSTFEIKKFLAGELGVRTGAEVSFVVHYQGDKSKIVDETIRRIFPLMKHSRWTGCLDINTIVNEQGCWFLEWTPRIGYSAIFAYANILGISLSEFFYKASRQAFTIPFRSLWGSSLKLSCPPYPVSIEDHKIAEEVYGKSEGLRINGKKSTDFWPIDVMKKEKEMVVSGVTCIVGECVGRGNTLLEAWRSCQAVFKGVEVANKGGRYVDGAEDAWKRILKLRKFGYMDVPNPSGFLGKETATSLPLIEKASSPVKL